MVMDLGELTSDDRIALTASRVHREFHRGYDKEDLYQRVQRAAKSIGIEDVVVREWKSDSYDSNMTHAVVRQSEYNERDDAHIQQRENDLGYFQFSLGKTIISFKINDNAFSHERYNQFNAALREEGLAPSRYNPLIDTKGNTEIVPIYK